MTREKLIEIQEYLNQQAKENMKRMGSSLKEFGGCADGMYFHALEEEEPQSKPLSVEHIFVWTPSFFTGMAALSFEVDRDMKTLQWLNQFYDEYYRKVVDTPMDTMHDLGFLYTPYAVALYKLTGDVNMKVIALKAADELAKRYYPKGNYIRAWGRVDDCIPEYVDEMLATDHFFTESKGLAIIDCMMNLPLLYWAAQETGMPYYRNIADAHAQMTQKYFIREDDSVAHAFRFNETTGQPIGVTNYCGYSDASYWARGASWAIYGFALAYKYTQNSEYLTLACRLGKKYIEQLGDTRIPQWDFRLPETEESDTDTSAAAVTACAFLELSKMTKDEAWLEVADQILDALSSEYMNTDLKIPGVLSGSNGRNHYWICGDYFFMEAIMKRLGTSNGYW